MAEQKRRKVRTKQRGARTINVSSRTWMWRDGDIVVKLKQIGEKMYNVLVQRHRTGPMISALLIDGDLVMLDKPKRDFSSREHYSTNYFYSTKIYDREPDLRERVERNYFYLSVVSYTGYKAVYPCPQCAPWIFNVTYLMVAGKRIKLKWVPTRGDSRI